MRRRYFISFSPLLLCLFIHLAFTGVVFGRDWSSDLRQGKPSHRRIDGQYAAGPHGDIIRHRGYEYYMSQRNFGKDPVLLSKKNSLRKATPAKKQRKKTRKKVNLSQKKVSEKSKRFYTVRRGDTLFGISRKTGVPLSRLKELNSLGNGNKILVGKRLRLHSSVTAKSSSAKSKIFSPCVKGLKFKWPLRSVKHCRRDGKKGVKPIGIIIKGNPGGVVRASERGIVRRVGYMRGFGNYIVIEHVNSYMTVYSNLGLVSVKEGQRIARGGKIGGLTPERLLHFQIDRKGRARNPLALLPSRS